MGNEAYGARMMFEAAKVARDLRELPMLKRLKEAATRKMRKRARSYYVSHFTTSELRRMLREAEDQRTGTEEDIYVIEEIRAALVRREWDEQ